MVCRRIRRYVDRSFGGELPFDAAIFLGVDYRVRSLGEVVLYLIVSNHCDPNHDPQ